MWLPNSYLSSLPSLSRPVPAPRSRVPAAPRAPQRSGNGQGDRWPRRGGGAEPAASPPSSLRQSLAHPSAAGVAVRPGPACWRSPPASEETRASEGVKPPELDDFPLEQSRDETLKNTFDRVRPVDGQLLQPDVPLSFPYFSLMKERLYRVT